MAGHSHSANVAIRKGAQDKKRAKLFTKLNKQIIVAARLGGPDMEANARLRLAVKKARSKSVPRDTIQRAIKKGSGELEGENYDELFFEGYGPGGVAIYCEVLTDNRNRAAAEVRHAFSKNGGNLGTTGCVGYMFQRTGVILVEGDEDAIMEGALEAGADDVEGLDDGTFEVSSDSAEMEAIADALRALGLTVTSEQVLFVPDTRTEISDGDAGKLLKMLDIMDDCDDIQTVYHNAEISPEAIAAYQDS